MLMATGIPVGQMVSVTTPTMEKAGEGPHEVVIPKGTTNPSPNLFIPFSLQQMALALEALWPLSLPGLSIPNLHLDSELNTPI